MLEQLQAAAVSAVDGIREGLAGRGHAAAVQKKVRLVDFRGGQLLEVGGWQVRQQWVWLLFGLTAVWN